MNVFSFEVFSNSKGWQFLLRKVVKGFSSQLQSLFGFTDYLYLIKDA